MGGERLDQINQFPSTDIRRPPTTTIADAIVASGQGTSKVRYDLLSWMRHQHKLNVFIHSQCRVTRNRVNQKWYATLIKVGLEMLKNRREHRSLFIANFMVREHWLTLSEKRKCLLSVHARDAAVIPTHPDLLRQARLLRRHLLRCRLGRFLRRHGTALRVERDAFQQIKRAFELRVAGVLHAFLILLGQ